VALLIGLGRKECLLLSRNLLFAERAGSQAFGLRGFWTQRSPGLIRVGGSAFEPCHEARLDAGR
jgi:hypothetical protein